MNIGEIEKMFGEVMALNKILNYMKISHIKNTQHDIVGTVMNF